MTTLAVNKPRAYEGAEQIEQSGVGVIAADIIYEGAAVGVVDATGYAQPLAATLNRFGGFCVSKADNAAGAAGDINCDIITRGRVLLTVSGVLITDRGQPVYATDDDTFQMSPVGGIYIGKVHRWVSSGVAIVSFNADDADPWGAWTSRLTISVDTTLDATHTGKLLWVDTDAKTITLPVIATGLDGVAIVNGGGFGAVLVTISPAAADSIFGPGITAADDKDLLNTKATARRGDFAVIGGNDADGYAVQMLRGTWARQA